MPPFTRLLMRRGGAVGLALTALDVWRRIPPEQRRRLVQEARRRGPQVASSLAERRRRRRSGP